VLILEGATGRTALANAAAIQLLLGEGAPPGLLPRFDIDFRLYDLNGQRIRDAERPGIRAVRGDVVASRQLVVERADGSRVPVLAQAAPLRTAAGEIGRAVLVFHDITRLREAEQLKDDFLALVSHEFRTPLTAIHGGAQLLVTEGDGLEPGVRSELLADIAEESGRLDRMLTNMLSLAAIMAGRMQAATEPVLLSSLARAVAAETARRATTYRFPVEISANLPPVEGDPELLRQVLRNLYENAVKYSTGEGEIRTTAEQAGSWVRLSVIDQGIGIAPEHVTAVFERFRRPGADPSVRGMGLGLYLSRHLIEVQHGRIWAESAGVGRGATFVIELPVAADWDEQPNSPGATE
jgi:signal transduction histidine kinase